MPTTPRISPVTGSAIPSSFIHTSDYQFRDQHGRSLLFRGVNLSGSAKAPDGQPSYAQGFFEAAEEGQGGFTDRPLDLDDGTADIHLARLRAWGFNFLRFTFTWEAIEHEGPGKYDAEYLDYVVRCLEKCGEWGFKVFMDPHQDVWSRFSGGSGAPLWTLYACGIDPNNMSATWGALIHSEWPTKEAPKPQEFPAMIWATNYTRLVSQTVFTLFYAGKTYAPKCIIDGKNIQDWLQEHFLDACGALAERMAEAPGLLDEVVIGWDSMNEPGDGMIGLMDLNVMSPHQQLKKGATSTPFEGMRLGMGEAVEVDVWDFGALGPSRSGKKVIDPQGRKLWLSQEDEATRGGGKWGWKRSDEWEMGTCIWALHGVWNAGTKKLLRPNYFNTLPSDATREVDFVNDFWVLHWVSYATRIRLHHPEAIHFIQPPVFAVPPKIPESFLKGRACTSPHYYDGLTLMTKHWNWFNADALGLLRGKYRTTLQAVKLGETAIRKSIQDQLGILQQDARERVGKYPTLIGEIGCPFDMDGKKAYGFTEGGRGKGDYSSQQKAWDCSLNAADGPNCLGFTLWTYVPDNSHQWSDLWNGEDLSLWSQDDCISTEVFSDQSGDKITNLSTRNSSSSSSPITTKPLSSLANSSATLVGRSSSASPYSPTSIQNGRGVTSALILDGARAIAATCRPYVIATVGVPERQDFDIASTSFKLSVRVGPGDKVPEGVATEVYLPFVHYAHALDLTTTYSDASRNNSTSSLIHHSDSSPHHHSHLFRSNQHVQKGEGATIDPTSPTNRSTDSLRLDITVRVSHGTYELKGQYLAWTYPIPPSDQTYTLEVKRSGGTLRRATEEAFGQSGGWGDVCSRCTVM